MRALNIFILVIALLSLPVVALPSYNLEEYFPLGEGNRWEYVLKKDENGTASVDREIIDIKGSEKIEGVDAKRMVSSVNDNLCVNIDSEGVKLYKYWESCDGDYDIYKPPMMLFPNIKVGEKKVYKRRDGACTLHNVECKPTVETGTLTIKLVAVEDVEVPAGKFKDCLKFVSLYKFKKVYIPARGRLETTTWLAPGVGKVKSNLNFTESFLDTKKQDRIIELRELKEASVNVYKPSSARELSTSTTPSLAEKK